MANNGQEDSESTHFVAKLDAAVTAGAENFSQGERQLVRCFHSCLGRARLIDVLHLFQLSIARALLRRTKVFIADEATTSVDFDTDVMVSLLDCCEGLKTNFVLLQIQRTLRRELQGATVLIIAHRLRTVIDVDRVIVMSEGIITETGSPRELLNDPESAFSELCRQSNELDDLKHLAGIA